MKRRILILALPLAFLTGLLIALYPAISNLMNNYTQDRVIQDYNEEIALIGDNEYASLLDEARAYNKRLMNNPARFSVIDPDEYNSILNVGGDGVIGILTIPDIGVRLPVYHGTRPEVLQVGAGHVEGSSFPVGGPGVHAAVTGHRGLPTAILLSEIDRLEMGSRFSINVLGETLTYEVDQSAVTLPDDMSLLNIEPDKDYLTLLTCTPYGVNSHRLLVRGRRVDSKERIYARVSQDAREVSVVPFLATITMILLTAFFIDLTRDYKACRGKWEINPSRSPSKSK